MKDKNDMPAFFDQARQGQQGGCILISGAALNTLFEAEIFPEETLFVVTRQGITELERPYTVN